MRSPYFKKAPEKQNTPNPSTIKITENHEKKIMKQVTWVIKASKFCNLRCKYCYEWNELADKTRMPLDLWRKIFIAIQDHHHILQNKYDGQVKSRLVIHGGEPFALPISYLTEVMQLKTKIFGTHAHDKDIYPNSLQTNLYRINSQIIDFIKRYNIDIGVSFDLIGGIRLAANGKETEERIKNNMDLCRKAGINIGGITVLAKHTSEYIEEIYDFYAEENIPFRILPLFSGYEQTNSPEINLSYDEIRASLKQLLHHWINQENRIRVTPLDESLQTVLRHKLGLKGNLYTRRHYGDPVILVNLDGHMYRVIDAYDQNLSLGNLNQQSISEILSSDRYEKSLTRDETETKNLCQNCKYAGTCNGWPIFESAHPETYQTHCPISYFIYETINDFLDDNGFTSQEIKTLSSDLLTHHHPKAGSIECEVTL